MTGGERLYRDPVIATMQTGTTGNQIKVIKRPSGDEITTGKRTQEVTWASYEWTWSEGTEGGGALQLGRTEHKGRGRAARPQSGNSSMEKPRELCPFSSLKQDGSSHLRVFRGM